jgi:hypothetical protein
VIPQFSADKFIIVTLFPEINGKRLLCGEKERDGQCVADCTERQRERKRQREGEERGIAIERSSIKETMSRVRRERRERREG